MAKKSTTYEDEPAAADDLKSEQDKGGKDPTSPAEESPGKAKTMEEHGIGPRDPYPTGGA